MTNAEINKMMTAFAGPDWKNKALVGPLGPVSLMECAYDCGWREPPRNESYGLYQIMPTTYKKEER